MKTLKYIIIVFLFSSCSVMFNQPTKKQAARFGEEVYSNNLISQISPDKPIVVGVYKFRDQTGQYKQVENGVSYSTAVTQGATTILIKALEDSKWFVPIERENVSNLLNERQIIRSTRKENNKKNGVNSDTSLPPLLFAGVLLEGGIISYDSNIITGGAGARYFGVGASSQYRQDRITIYLRAVSTSNGKILKTVYISKTILSQAIDVNLFRFVNVKRLLEVETGVSQNEPGQLAIKEAIEKAVESLIIEGIKDNIWEANENVEVIDSIVNKYNKEKIIDNQTQLFNRKILKNRDKHVINVSCYSTYFDGDYNNSTYNFDGFQVGYKYFLKQSKFSFGGRVSNFTLSNDTIFSHNYFTADLNLEYNFLPTDKFTPIMYVGGGGLFVGFNHYDFKVHGGLGLEYIVTKNFGINLFAEKSFLFTDEIDGKVQGKMNDSFWKFGLGVNVYLNNN